jgi:hypothetical protein
MTQSLPSGLNDFLFTPIADEANGMHLTMLSALARSGVDPWEEAAGLRTLSREDATEKLVRMLSGVPNGPSPGDDTATLAARLVARLHASPKAAPPKSRSSPAAVAAGGEEPPLRSFSTLPRRVKLTIYSLLTLILLVAGYRTLVSSESDVSSQAGQQMP